MLDRVRIRALPKGDMRICDRKNRDCEMENATEIMGRTQSKACSDEVDTRIPSCSLSTSAMSDISVALAFASEVERSGSPSDATHDGPCCVQNEKKTA